MCSDEIGAATASVTKPGPEPVGIVGDIAWPEPVAGIVVAPPKALITVDILSSNAGWGVHSVLGDLPLHDFEGARGVRGAKTSTNSVNMAIADRAVLCDDRCPKVLGGEPREDRRGDLAVRARRARGWEPKPPGFRLRVDLGEGLLTSPKTNTRLDLDPDVGILCADELPLDSEALGVRCLPDAPASSMTGRHRYQL
ncbi:MAG: hypothetical protein JWM85_2851 [Acidimicrobiaceae bacterium]|nr:hypothetical protein [Acidimicrobiaceae bacterium]